MEEITPAMAEGMADQYKNGATIQAIALGTGFSYFKVYRILKGKVTFRKRGGTAFRIPQEIRAAIQQEYGAVDAVPCPHCGVLAPKPSMMALAEKYNISAAGVFYVVHGDRAAPKK